ncbi:putative ribonuclease H-like domain-containing protein, partial [Tanacetum coccineum]
MIISRVENPDASKNNLVVMLYLLSEIQQSEYGLLEPRTLVCQNLVVGLLGHQQGLLYHTLYAQCVQGETHLKWWAVEPQQSLNSIQSQIPEVGQKISSGRWCELKVAQFGAQNLHYGHESHYNNNGDNGTTRGEGKIGGGGTVDEDNESDDSLLVAKYACLICMYGSLGKGDYDLWSMGIEQYLTQADYALWEVIMNGDAPAIASASTEDSQAISSSTTSQNVDFVTLDDTSILNEHLEHIDADDLEEMDFKWQVAMLTIRVKRFIKKTGRKIDLNNKETVGFDRTKVECYNCHRSGNFARECRAPRNQGNRNRDASRRNAPVDTSTTNALVVQDGIGGYDWSFQAEEGLTNIALMAYSSSLSGSDSEVHTCSKDCYQMGLESLEARIVVLEKNEAVYEEDIAFLKYDVQVKDISMKDLKNQLVEALKEKDDLKLKLEKFKESSKNLTKL